MTSQLAITNRPRNAPVPVPCDLSTGRRGRIVHRMAGFIITDGSGPEMGNECVERQPHLG